MATEGIIAIKNTAPKYLKGAADQTIRNRLWLSLLRENGRIKLGDGGVSCYWNVMARQPEIRQNGDAGQQVFSEHDAYEQLVIDVRGYVGTDRLTLKKKLMNKGSLQIVDLYGTKLENLTKSLSDNFGAELYVDGYATGNENRLCGIESCCGDDGATVAADIVARPSDTYGGKSTVLGTLGGTWTANLPTPPNATIAKDWPYGSGSSEYDYIAPKLINYSSTSWPSGGTTWRENCSVVMRRARTWCKSTGGNDNIPMLHLLSSSLYDDFEDYQESKFRTIVPHKTGEDLGFPDVLNFNGAMVKHEFDCPANVGYGVNLQDMLLFSIHDEFFYTFGPEFNLESISDLMLVGFFGNVRLNPRAVSKYKAYA